VSSVLVTGAAGYVGQRLVRALGRDPGSFETVIATDVRETPAGDRVAGVRYEACDVRSPALADLVARFRVDTVVHLATVVTPGKGTPREVLYDVDVRGTENVLAACVREGVARLVVTSSGAAYGYHADNPALITEDAPLRGNEAFAYSHHKRIVEELLARALEEHPGLAQLVFRPGTILGPGAKNQITDIFTKPVVVGLRESETPFVFVSDEDVVRVIAAGVREGWTGRYNLAGEGVMTLREIARRLGKPFVGLPEGALKRGIAALARVGATQYGPEQTAFLAHRPVLSADKLRRERGVRLTPSREVFEVWARAHERGRASGGRRRFAGASVLVTGAASGIGLATARRFAAEGARVAIVDLDEAAARAAAGELEAAGATALAVGCDVRDEAACARAVEAVRGAFGGVDVLVNNAGIAHRSLFAETDAAVLRRVMDVNWFGAVAMTKAALPSLVERRGAVVAVSSVAGFAPLVGRTGYAASKHALHGFFDTLRSEVAERGVGVTIVCPSFTDTAIDRHALGKDGGPAAVDKATVGELATPEQIADALVEGVARGDERVLPTSVSRSAWWLSRLAPTAYERVMLDRQGREFGVGRAAARRRA
jgi:UDP-glucose 4-epimerase